jgi:hypothetical protein
MPLHQLGVFVEGFLFCRDHLELYVRFEDWVDPDYPPWWSAADSEGNVYDGMISQFHGGILQGSTMEVHFRLPDDRGASSLRVTADTPFESAWLEFEMPSRWPGRAIGPAVRSQTEARDV